MLKSITNKSIIRSLGLTSMALVLFAQIELFAAKGDAKEKKGFVLKFNGFELKNTTNPTAPLFTMKPGMIYKGSFNSIEKAPQQTTLQSIITFQKGNTTFIYPYQHKVILPKFKTPEPPKFQ